MRTGARFRPTTILLRLARLAPLWLVRRVNAWQFQKPAVRRALARTLARQISAREGRIARGPGAGLLIDPGRTNPGFLLGTTEPAVQAAFAEYLRPGDIVFDIGANVGFFSLIAARLVGDSGAVYAFEPVPEYADLVESNARRNGFANVRVLRQAISAGSGTDTLLLSDSESPPGTDRLESVRPGSPAGATLDVSTASLDELVSSGEIPPPNLVKIDVEGAELDVVRGMAETIGRHEPVLIVELHWTQPGFLGLARDALRGYELRRVGDDAAVGEQSWMHVVAIPPARRAG